MLYTKPTSQKKLQWKLQKSYPALPSFPHRVRRIISLNQIAGVKKLVEIRLTGDSVEPFQATL
jgi:hypothetical protein